MASMITLEVTSASCTELLNKISAAGVELFDVSDLESLQIRFKIRRKDYLLTKKLLDKHDASYSVTDKHGVYWLTLGLIYRPVLIVGVLILLFMTVYLPTKVLFVEITGNHSVPAHFILDKAETCGIRFGASRRQLRNEAVKNYLLEEIKELQWAAVNTRGCVATITVEEKADIEKKEDTEKYGNIIASRDGVITEMTVLNGTALCKVGQAVNRGQTLVSGYGDYGLLVKATGADGEVKAQTIHKVTTKTLTESAMRTRLKDKKDRYSIIIGKNIINFSKGSGIYPTKCVRMYKEYNIILPGGFRLPVSLIKESCLYYDTETVFDEDLESCAWVEKQTEETVLDSMIGGQIIRKLSGFDLSNGVCKYECTYICHEVISRIRKEEILLKHE